MAGSDTDVVWAVTLEETGAYAFDELALEKVLASVYSGNDASVWMLEKIGYQQCGLLRRNAFFGGQCHDEWLGELLREDRPHSL